jgi:hypothetical protein
MDPAILKAVEKWAADDFRSSNGQLEWMIHEALRKAGRLPKRNSSESVNNFISFFVIKWRSLLPPFFIPNLIIR